MRTRLPAAAVGIVFGFTLVWSGMSDPDVIRRGLLFDEAYLFLLFGSAVATASVGVQLLRRFRFRALATGELVSVDRSAPARRHVVGSALFGVGWAIAAACPGPIAAQIGSGVGWSVATLAGVALGIKLFLVRQKAESALGSTASSS